MRCFAAHQRYTCFLKKPNVENCIVYCSSWRQILQTSLRQRFDGYNRECSNLGAAELGPHICLVENIFGFERNKIQI